MMMFVIKGWKILFMTQLLGRIFQNLMVGRIIPDILKKWRILMLSYRREFNNLKMLGTK